MKAENETTGHNRTIRITGIPDVRNYLPTLLITIGYVNEPDDVHTMERAVTLDDVVIPDIIAALNAQDERDTQILGEYFPTCESDDA